MKRKLPKNAAGHTITPWATRHGPTPGRVWSYRYSTCGARVEKMVPPGRAAPATIACGMPLTLGEPRSYCRGVLEREE